MTAPVTGSSRRFSASFFISVKIYEETSSGEYERFAIGIMMSMLPFPLFSCTV